MRKITTAISALLLFGCAETEMPETSLPFFGNGYRADGDQCRRLGESPDTSNYLDDMADLVGCPEDMENLGVFVTDTGAVEAFRQDGYIIYSVPRG